MNLENNIYKIDLTPKNFSNKNEVYNRLQGKECVIHFIEIGLPIRGIYEYEKDKLKIFYTSDVMNITEKEDGNIFVETKNTFYRFKKLEN